MVQILERRGRFIGNYTADQVQVNAAPSEKPSGAAPFRQYDDGILHFPQQESPKRQQGFGENTLACAAGSKR
jgi:hypothetical protein